MCLSLVPVMYSYRRGYDGPWRCHRVSKRGDVELAGRLKCPRFSWHPYGRLECLSIPYKLIDAGLQPPQRRSLRAPAHHGLPPRAWTQALGIEKRALERPLPHHHRRIGVFRLGGAGENLQDGECEPVAGHGQTLPVRQTATLTVGNTHL